METSISRYFEDEGYSAHQSKEIFQYLLQGIAANRDRTTLSDREIRNLLSDFKPHRTKWVILKSNLNDLKMLISCFLGKRR